MSVLARYLNRVVALRLVIVLFAITGFAVVLDLLDVGDAFTQAPEGAPRAALRYIALRLPMIVSELLPLAALVAGILAVGDLLRHRELVVIWGTGLSARAVLQRLLPMALVLLGAKLVLDDQGVPRVAAELRAWGIGEFKQGSVLGDPGDWYWLRAGDDVLRIAADAAAAGRLMNVTVFKRDDRGILTETLEAATAEPEGGGLKLLDVTRRVIATRAVERLPELLWTGAIDLSLVRLLATPPRELSTARLIEILAAGAYGMRAAEPYATALHARAAGSLMPGLLLLLAFALGRGFSRTATIAPILIKGIAIGFTAIILAGVAGATGEIGVLPPTVAAWSPVATLAAIVVLLARPGQGLRPRFA